MKRDRTTGMVILALLLALGACAPARVAPDGAAAGATAAVDRELVVRVENNLAPATALTVWLEPEAGTRRMLGTIDPRGDSSFPLDALVDGRFRLFARTAAGAEIASDPFTPMIPGVVRWDVTANTVATTGLDEKRTPADDPSR
jgi:hypothetical protein